MQKLIEKAAVLHEGAKGGAQIGAIEVQRHR